MRSNKGADGTRSAPLKPNSPEFGFKEYGIGRLSERLPSVGAFLDVKALKDATVPFPAMMPILYVAIIGAPRRLSAIHNPNSRRGGNGSDRSAVQVRRKWFEQNAAGGLVGFEAVAGQQLQQFWAVDDFLVDQAAGDGAGQPVLETVQQNAVLVTSRLRKDANWLSSSARKSPLRHPPRLCLIGLWEHLVSRRQLRIVPGHVNDACWTAAGCPDTTCFRSPGRSLRSSRWAGRGCRKACGCRRH